MKEELTLLKSTTKGLCVSEFVKFQQVISVSFERQKSDLQRLRLSVQIITFEIIRSRVGFLYGTDAI